jgi:sigma-B regulation protein RsbU (phosphoserine phosphatase)
MPPINDRIALSYEDAAQKRGHGVKKICLLVLKVCRLVAMLAFFANSTAILNAQNALDPSAGKAIESIPIIDRGHAQEWSSDISAGWSVHDGDDRTWARPAFDDSGWETVRLDNLGPAKTGWRWYRLRLKLHENHPDLSLLIEGGDGTYELYVNGVTVPGPALQSSVAIKRPIERALPLDVPGTDVEIAFRTHAPPSYSNWRLPLFLSISLGTPAAIEAQRQAKESSRLYSALPSISINLLIILGGIAAVALFLSQRKRREYLWLGVYLLLQGTAYLVWGCQQVGLFPTSANFLFSDPTLFVVAIAQIEFTFSFGGQRVGRYWRIYEVLLLVPLPLIWLTWQGHFSSDLYIVLEGLILVPVALLLPVVLLLWYRRGNREAGWLILPSLLPAATISTFDLGTLSIFFGWQRLDFLDSPIQLGPIPVQPGDIGDLLFLLAITIVMFFRFTRVSREQARAAAELEAAREIQQRLVPESLPELPGFQLEAAYLPAQEVGGDFYQILSQTDGSAIVIVGDVSGKGLKAAMTGALAIGALRTLAAEHLGPAALLTRLNRQIHDTQDSGFITCLCTRIASDGKVTVANAGHLSPYRGGEEIPVDSGLPLGLASGIEYSETQFQLEPGDTLTLISDGVLEAMNPDGQLYGFERTRAISTQSARNIASAAQAFGQEDDITVLTVMLLTL